jgi:hypothetical protein
VPGPFCQNLIFTLKMAIFHRLVKCAFIHEKIICTICIRHDNFKRFWSKNCHSLFRIEFYIVKKHNEQFWSNQAHFDTSLKPWKPPIGGCFCILMKSSISTNLNLFTPYHVSIHSSMPSALYGASTRCAYFLEDEKSASNDATTWVNSDLDQWNFAWRKLRTYLVIYKETLEDCSITSLTEKLHMQHPL